MKNIILFVFISFLCGFSAAASEPAIWSVNTRAQVLKGDSKGVSISETGAITLAPKLSEIYNTEQSYVWSSAVDAAGNVFLGTGGDGRVFRVEASGNGKLLTDLAELNVSALAIGRDNILYAGTSPDGKVYRISASGAPEIFFEPKEKYIWSLSVFSDGSLAVGTGEDGKIYRVKAANAKPENSLLFDTSETHIISLAVDKQDNLYAGTDAKGLVLRFSADGKPFALLDSSLREIHQISIGSDNSVYALAVSDSAAAKTAATTAENAPAATETSAAQPEVPAKSRYDLSAAKSAVYRIFPDGGSDVVWNSANVTAFSIQANPNGSGVLIGTSDKGRIYSVTNTGQETLVLQSNEGQISTFQTRGNQLLATSSNQGKLYRIDAGTAAEGSYESSVLDAKAAAIWGNIRWHSSGSVTLQTRSGNTEKPDEAWSAWSAAYAEQKGTQISSPKAKFLQWRAILKNSSGAASLNEVNVAYLARNIAPEVLSIQILPTNVGLLANPPIQIDPNIENSGIDPTIFGLPPMMNVQPRRVYQRGARALQWTAEDRNGDRLEYAVYYREAGENNFKLLRENQRENFFTLDGAALADGRYIFKIAANDSPSNPASQSLSGEKISEPIDIDNTAPTVTAIGTATKIANDKSRVVFEAIDSSSYLNKAEYSVNGGDWREIYADDAISDSARERYSLEIPLKNAAEISVSLRVFDANGNVGSARILINEK